MQSMKMPKSIYVALLLIMLISTLLPIDSNFAHAAQSGNGNRTEVKIDGGGSHSLALKPDGTVVAWGNNAYGQTDVPAELNGVAAISAGWSHSLALKSDGTVAAWGYNGSDQTDVPEGLNGVVAIAAGFEHSLALKSDGTVAAWGYNGSGQTTVPEGLNGVVAISAGWNHSMALKSDGTVVAWGSNDLGLTTIAAGLNGVVAISAGGNHSLALKSDGTVVAWGYNGSGQTTVPEGLNGVTAISGAGDFSLAIKSDGTVVAWGENGFGQTTVPAGVNGVVAISAGYHHSLAIKSDGTVVAWGNNGTGQTTVPAGLSLSVKGDWIAAGGYHSLALKQDGTVVAWGENNDGQTNLPGGLNGVSAIAAGGYHSLALKSNGTVAAWGDNSYGQTTVPVGLSGVSAIAAGGNHSLALKSDGTVAAWGDNNYGQTTVPVGLNGVVAIAAGFEHSLALKSDGTVAAWGYNGSDQTDVPVGLNGVVAIAAGMSHSLALKSDGTVAAWGDNNYGQTTVPVGLNGVVAIAAGFEHSLALKSDGTVTAWGYNVSDQTDVPVGLNGVVAIAAGIEHSLALKSDGTVAAWGDNNYGQTTVPGSASLSGLSLQEGALYPAFHSSVSDYIYSYIGPTVSSVHVTATLADTSHGTLYINHELQSSGGEKTITMTGPSTVIPVRVEPYLLPGKTYTITVLRDSMPPDVQFSVNGNTVSAKTASTQVTVTDAEIGIDPASLQYAWTQTTAAPASGWTFFNNGDMLTRASGEGNWYLHVRATDLLGNTANKVSSPFILDNTAPTVVLNGSDPMYVPVGQPYTEPGATVTDAIYGEPESWITTTGNVDTSSLGTYHVSYQAADNAGNLSSPVTRTVHVYDGDVPAIYLKGPNPMTVEVNSSFTDPGATAFDLYDGDISSIITATGTVDTQTIGTYTLLYNVADHSGNAALEVTRTVYVKDTTPPVITLLGDNPMVIGTGSSFQDPGAMALDEYEGDVTSLITVTGSVDTSRTGTYRLDYNVTDRAYNASVMATRTVHVIALPIITLSGQSAMSLRAGDPFTDPGAQATDGYYGDISNSITVIGSVHTQTPGTYTLRYNVQNPAGMSAEEVTRTVTVVAVSESNHSGDWSPPPTVVNMDNPTTAIVKINSEDVKVKMIKETSGDGQSVMRITLDADQLAATFFAKPEFIIEIKNSDPGVKVDLPAGTLLDALSRYPGATVQIKVAEASYSLPVSVLTNAPKDAVISVAITKVSDESSAALTVQNPGSQQLLDNPVDYSVQINGKEIMNFNGTFVVRTLTLHSAVDPSHSTAVWADAHNELHFIPSVFSNSGDLTMATIYSPHNSTYTVIQSDKTFEDVREHWAQADIELLVNKRIAEGITADTFAPDIKITRAEFAALLVRSLGLVENKEGNPFTDVKTGDWFAGAVETAQKAGLISGYKDGTFRPNAHITREQMVSMIALALKFVGKVPQVEAPTFEQFTDASKTADWAKEAAAQLLAAQIIQGMDETTLGPKENATRAQSAVMLKRMLQYLQFIN